MKLIQGVHVKPLKVIADERGYLMEMMRNDDLSSSASASRTFRWPTGRGEGMALPQGPDRSLRDREGNDEGRAVRPARGIADEGLINEFFMGSGTPSSSPSLRASCTG